MHMGTLMKATLLQSASSMIKYLVARRTNSETIAPQNTIRQMPDKSCCSSLNLALTNLTLHGSVQDMRIVLPLYIRGAT